MATSVRRETLTLPAAPLGRDNPLPPLFGPRDVHDTRVPRDAMAPDMARQLGHAPLRSLLPVPFRDGYGRARRDTDVEALVLENERLRVTVLPGLGGRVHSLVHKPTGRELLYRNPVLQPADFALNGAWFSGGIEWNTGATGHTALSCSPLHAARVPAPDGGEMLRLWEWERLRDLPFQVDLWLPPDSDFLLVGVRLRNPRPTPTAVYWWSNTAVPETPGGRVLAPADSCWAYGYERDLARVPVPHHAGTDRTYPLHATHPADYFYEVADKERRWVAAVDRHGAGLVQTSTDLLRGRKLFVWGTGAAGRRWQEWFTEPGTGGYAEIQAGLARTQMEHVPLEGGAEFAWLEAYGPLDTDPTAVHGPDWAAARAEVADRLEAALPRATVDAAFAAWRPFADHAPKERLATGSGWGALEVLRASHDLPGTPFEEATLTGEQGPWLTLWRTGDLPPADGAEPPGPTLVADHWRDLLETASDHTAACYHRGVAQWHAGDRSQAARSWECAVAAAPQEADAWPALRALAWADGEAGHPVRGAERILRAFRLAHHAYGTPPTGTAAVDAAGEREAVRVAALAALAREAVTALLGVGRAREAADVLAALPPDVSARGRHRLLEARVLLALGDAAGARKILDTPIEVADLREGEETLSDTWYAVAEALEAAGGPVTDAVRERAGAAHPLPRAYEFRMRPV